MVISLVRIYLSCVLLCLSDRKQHKFLVLIDVSLSNLANMAEPEEELQREDGGSTKKVEKRSRRKKENRREKESQELEEEKERCL